ncbi:hypothetical protein [Limnofasciculus baicalensis]|uniref:Uncharacterized protein n=1 Tax=Limnofasciculus baicalensis BBK-W-15 TaxID=2699891 RepID=A0AAE3KR35_9CYAN|nr:hypothetical protein [Limnofasciculus baicalensis]MCP2727997.1 hypothetical protein [Limnofasciculus baicalensis BBK-W-15]
MGIKERSQNPAIADYNIILNYYSQSEITPNIETKISEIINHLRNNRCLIVRELFGGRVTEFLQCEMPILDESLQFQLSQQFQRLTQAELAIMSHLANQPQPLPFSQFLNQIQLSPSELVNGVRSLRNRFLLEVIEEKEITLFSLNPVLKQYVKTRYSDS